jgi:hypothetical protein
MPCFHDAPTADGDEEICAGRLCRICAPLDGRPVGTFVHDVEDSGIQRPELILDALKEIRPVCHGLPAHHKSAQRLCAADLVAEMAQGIDAHMQPPGITHGPKRVCFQDLHGCLPT